MWHRVSLMVSCSKIPTWAVENDLAVKNLNPVNPLHTKPTTRDSTEQAAPKQQVQHLVYILWNMQMGSYTCASKATWKNDEQDMERKCGEWRPWLKAW